LYLEDKAEVLVLFNETCKKRFEQFSELPEGCLKIRGTLEDFRFLKIVYPKADIENFTNSKVTSSATIKNILIVSDTDNHCIRAIDFETSMISVIAGECGTPGFKDGFIQTSRLNTPKSLGIDRRNRIYVDDFGNRQIRILDFDMNYETFQKFVFSVKIKTLEKGSCFDLPAQYTFIN
jgi:hypothetical protein